MELLKLFIDTGISDLAELRAAVEAGDKDKVVNAAHSLKGAAGSLGLQEFYNIAKKVELLAREDKLDLISKDIQIVNRSLEIYSNAMIE
jgi:two-component system sensor histidine kinase TorS